MRAFLKKQLCDILNTMMEMHSVILSTENNLERNGYLAECQNTALLVGENIEQSAVEFKNAIYILEEYCSELYKISVSGVFSDKNLTCLNNLLKSVIDGLNRLDLTYKVVFFPYSASMWDCMESVWEACKNDEQCECYVVPIPYYKFNASTSELESVYEGNRMPSYVNIIDYREFDFELENLDIAYIHNPYDERNRVTTVEPRFYTSKLRNHIRKVVYIPYYVTSGFVSQEHLDLPAYRNVDHIIVQSKNVAKAFDGSEFRHKVAALGSPKFDSVISKDKSENSDRKISVLLNTSLWQFLNDHIRYIRKIKLISEFVSQQSDLEVIWRPHPLLESTIHAMKSELLSDYYDLVSLVNKSPNIKIDQRASISEAVSLSDAYIGEESSSIVNLFSVTGKPLFFLDNSVNKIDFNSEMKVLMIAGSFVLNQALWFTSSEINGLFKMDLESRRVEYVGSVEDAPMWRPAFSGLDQTDSNIFLAPDFSESPCFYSVESRYFNSITLEDPQNRVNLHYSKVKSYGSQVFYFPLYEHTVLEYNRNSKTWTRHNDMVKALINGKEVTRNVVWDVFQDNDELWLCAGYTNRVVKLNMSTSKYDVYDVGSEKNGYASLVKHEGCLWLSETSTGHIVKYHILKNQMQYHEIPDSIIRKNQSKKLRYSHRKLLNMENYIIAIPSYSNGIVKINKTTYEMVVLAHTFFSDLELLQLEVDGLKKPACMTEAIVDDTRIIVQRTYDGALALIDVVDDTYEMFYPSLDDLEYKRVLGKHDGFEKIDQNAVFARRESCYFSLKGFFDDLVNDNLIAVTDRQLREAQDIAEYLDGTSGQNIHDYIMNSIKEDEYE